MADTADVQKMQTFIRRLGAAGLKAVDAACDTLLSSQGSGTAVEVLKGLCLAEVALRNSRKRRRR